MISASVMKGLKQIVMDMFNSNVILKLWLKRGVLYAEVTGRRCNDN